MHELVNILQLLLLLSSSSLKLAISFPIEVTNLISSNGVFKVDLIHRDSPLSPYYNSSITPQDRVIVSRSRAGLGSISHSHNIHAPSYLIPNGGDYLMKFALGTPKVEVIAVADTGSDLIWIQCSPCKECIPQKSPLFTPKNSSTFHSIPCTSPSCNIPHITKGCLSNNTNKHQSPCFYEALYGDGTQSVGFLAKETISLHSLDYTPSTSLHLPSTIFGCGFYQQGQIGYQGEGIVGLGTGPLSLVSQLGPLINYRFSYCLSPLSSKLTSKLTFGGRVIGPKVVSTPFFTERHPTFYHLTLHRVSIGKNSSSFPLDDEDIIIDSGTTLTYLPPTVYDGIKSALDRAIKLTPVPDPMQFYDLCYDVRPVGAKRQFYPPNVVFHFKGGNVVLKAINTFRTLNYGLTCLAMSSIEGTPVFGNVAQVNFEVGYNLKAKMVSFSPADCTKY